MGYPLLCIGPFIHGARLFLTGFSSEYRVIHVPKATKGLSRLKSEIQTHCVTVLLDLAIEDEDGFEVLTTIKTHYPMVEVIVLTPYPSAAWTIEAMRLGAYVVEPYESTPEFIIHYIEQLRAQFDLLTLAKTMRQKKKMDELWLNLSQLQHEGLPLRLLIVEDEPLLADTLNNILGGLFNYTITVASTKAEALSCIANQPAFRVVLLDIGLPDGQGIELISPILTKNPNTEILMLTAYKALPPIIQSFKLGASDYILKPFQIAALQHAISKAAQRAMCKSLAACELPAKCW